MHTFKTYFHNLVEQDDYHDILITYRIRGGHL